MKNLVAAFGAVLFCAVSVNAQGTATINTTDAATMESGTHHECLMADAATWKTLGLNEEQITKVKAIQDKCKAEKAASTDMKTDAKTDMSAKHETELQAVLTKDQYANWQKWCATQHPEKANTDMK